MTKKSKVNWDVCISNALVAFATTGAATQISGLGLEGLISALYAAIMIGVLAFATEYKKEASGMLELQNRLLIISPRI